MNDIFNIQKKTGWPLQKVIKDFGLNRQRLNRWKMELENNIIPIKKMIPTKILPDEEKAILSYRILNDTNRNMGYRKLTWKMVDENIAFVSESTVYRVLKHLNLLGKSFKQNDGAKKEYENKPKYVHHHWHTDLAYVKISGEHYFLIFLLDGFSRYILGWDLMTDMTSKSVELFTQKILDKYPNSEPMIIHDNGVQFISHDFKNVLNENDCIDVPTRIKHPETNGKAERFIGLVRQEALNPNSPVYYSEAVKVIEKYIDEYNNRRYHSGIKYLKPVDVFEGRGEQILRERKKKLAMARNIRTGINYELHRKLENLLA